MTIRLMGTSFGAAVLAAGLTFAASAPAAAQSVMKECSTKYEAAKAGNTLAGQTWPQFYSQCSKDMKAAPAAVTAPAKPAVVAPVVAAPKPAVVAPAAIAAPAKPMAPAVAAPAATGGAVAEQSRIKTCGAEWKANKATLKPQYGSWPKYWSACDARIKTSSK